MSKNILLKDIVKIQHLYIGIFEEEDSDYVDYRVVRNKERAVYRILDKYSSDPEEQKKIYNIIASGSWDKEDYTFKTICNRIRELGYEVIEG